MKRYLITVMIILTLAIAGCGGNNNGGGNTGGSGGGLTTPVDIKGKVSGTEITLTWVGEGESYVVSRSTSGGLYVQAGTTTVQAFTDRGLREDTSYSYKVKSIRGSKESGESELIYLRTTIAAPSNFRITEGGIGYVKLSWDKSMSSATYTVERSTASGIGYKEIATVTEPMYTDSSVEMGKSYFYRVRGNKDYTKGGYTAEQGYYPEVATPQGLSRTSVGEGVKVTWESVPGAERYKVYRGAAADGEYAEAGVVEKTEYTDTGLVKGKMYYYKVKAVNSHKESSMSGYLPYRITPDFEKIGESIDATKSHAEWITGIKLMHDGKRIVTRSGDDTIRIWDKNTGEILRVISLKDVFIKDIDITNDDRKIIAVVDNSVREYDVETGVELKNTALEGKPNTLLLNGDNTELFIGNYGDYKVRVFTYPGMMLKSEYTAPEENVEKFVCDKEKKRIGVVTLKYTDIYTVGNTWTKTRTLSFGGTDLSMTSDGKYLICTEGGKVYYYNIDTQKGNNNGYLEKAVRAIPSLSGSGIYILQTTPREKVVITRGVMIDDVIREDTDFSPIEYETRDQWSVEKALLVDSEDNIYLKRDETQFIKVNTKEGKIEKEFGERSDYSWNGVFSNDNKYFAYGGEIGGGIYNIEEKRVEGVMNTSSEEYFAAGITPDNTKACFVVGNDVFETSFVGFEIYTVPDMKLYKEIKVNEPFVMHVSLAVGRVENERIYYGTQNGEIKILNFVTGETEKSITVSDIYKGIRAFRTDGKRGVLVAERNFRVGKVYIIDMETGKIISESEEINIGDSEQSVSADMRKVVCGTSLVDVGTMRAISLKNESEFNYPIRILSDDRIIGSNYDRGITFEEIYEDKVIKKFDYFMSAQNIWISDDGNYFAHTANNGNCSGFTIYKAK